MMLEYHKQYYLDHKDDFRKRSKKWRDNNYEIAIAINRKSERKKIDTLNDDYLSRSLMALHKVKKNVLTDEIIMNYRGILLLKRFMNLTHERKNKDHHKEKAKSISDCLKNNSSN